MSLLLLLRPAVEGEVVPPELQPGRKYIGVQIGRKTSKPLIYPVRYECDETYLPGVQIGRKASSPLSDRLGAYCTDGVLDVDSKAVGVQIGGRLGKPLVFVTCREECRPDPPPPTYPITCCAGVRLPGTFNVVVGGTICHDGSYPVTYTPTAPVFAPLAYFFNVASVFGLATVWMSDVYETDDVTETCEIVDTYWGCTYERVDRYRVYHVVTFNSVCGMVLWQYHRHTRTVTPISGDCHIYESASFDQYVYLTGSGAPYQMAPLAVGACNILACSPFHMKRRLQVLVGSAPWCNLAPPASCTAFPIWSRDLETTGTCSGASHVGPYFEITM